MKKTAAVLACLLIASVVALADDKPAGSAVHDSLAPPNCTKPSMPSSVRSADDTTEFDEKVDAYKDCITTYVSDQNALAKKHMDAANGAVNEYNDFTKVVNEYRASKNH